MTAHKSRGWRATLGAVLLLWCTIFAQHSWALGLDEIEVTSALNERFSATIELLDSQGFQPSEIVVKMAGREDFDRIGVERFFFLTDLRFKVEPDASGNAQVVVSSTKPVSEPYLNFIVEVLWPSGRLLKEYTVLLDPPNFSQASAPLVDRPQTAAAAPSEPVQQAPAVTTERPGTRVNLDPQSQPVQAQRRAPVESGDGVMTTIDDTLWKIANRTRQQDVSVNQQMLALQRINPRAFIRGNINLLKAGYLLELPTTPEALALSNTEADAQVAEHAQAWREQRTMVAQDSTRLQDQAGADQSLASQVDATPVQIDADPSASSGEGQVRILANSGTAGEASGSGEVDQLIEERAALTRQVEELSTQLDTEKELATNQVAVKERQLEVKDQEIAQLQQQLSEMRGEMQKIAESQNQSSRTPTPEPVPLWQTPVFLFGVIGVLILALVVVLILLRRNRAEAEALEAYIDDQPLDDGAEYEEAEEVAAVADMAHEQAVDDESLDTEQPIEPTISEHEVLSLDDDDMVELPEEGDDAVQEEEPGGETSDVIGEAEIYIAYGRYGQAANLLLGVLNKEPDRHDVRLKLLETYVESQDDDNFAVHAEYLLQNTDDEDVLHACRELEAQLNDSRVVLDDDGADAGDAGDSDATDSGDEEDALALDLDDLEPLDAEAGDEGLEGHGEEELALDSESDAVDEDDFTLEFDEPVDLDESDSVEDLTPELDNEPTEETVETESSGHSDDLGGDLGIDFDPDRDVADYPVEDDQDENLDDLLADLDTPAAAEDAQGDDETLEFDLDLGEASEETADTADTVEEDLAGFAEPAQDSVEAAEPLDADGFDFGSSDEDVNETKLDLAAAYIDMGDQDGAKDILDEVLKEGSEAQQGKAKELLEQLA